MSAVKIIGNSIDYEKFENVFNVLFPEQKTLNLLVTYFQSKYGNGEGKIYKTLKELCIGTINRITKRCT